MSTTSPNRQTDGCIETNNDPESTETPSRYCPDSRLCDDPDRLRVLYVERDKTIREIAAHNDCEVSRTTVSKRLREYDIIETDTTTDSDERTMSVSASSAGNTDCVSTNARSLAPAHSSVHTRGRDPPQPSETSESVQWDRLTD